MSRAESFTDRYVAYVRTRMASVRGAEHYFGRLHRDAIQSGLYLGWYADNIWLFVPVQQKLREFLTTLPEYPFQQGSSLNAANINYVSLKALEAMKRLKQLESLRPPSN